MKKYLAGLFAIILGVGASAFTARPGSADDPVYNWNHYTGSTSSPTITMVQLTDAEAQEEDCPGNTFKCLVKLDENLNETDVIFRRPAQ